MEYKILEARGVEIENYDGGAFNNFCANGLSGIIPEVLDECKITTTGSIITVNAGVLLIKGYRVKILSPVDFYPQGLPYQDMEYRLVAKVDVSGRSVSFDMYLTNASSLLQEDIYKNTVGTYELELAKFIHTHYGTIENLQITAKKIRPANIDNALSKESENPVQNKVIANRFEAVDNAVVTAQNMAVDAQNTAEEALRLAQQGGSGGTSNIDVDDELSTYSTNPVQNKVVTEAINKAVSDASSALAGTGVNAEKIEDLEKATSNLQDIESTANMAYNMAGQNQWEIDNNIKPKLSTLENDVEQLKQGGGSGGSSVYYIHKIKMVSDGEVLVDIISTRATAYGSAESLKAAIDSGDVVLPSYFAAGSGGNSVGFAYDLTFTYDSTYGLMINWGGTYSGGFPVGSDYASYSETVKELK